MRKFENMKKTLAVIFLVVVALTVLTMWVAKEGMPAAQGKYVKNIVISSELDVRYVK